MLCITWYRKEGTECLLSSSKYGSRWLYARPQMMDVLRISSTWAASFNVFNFVTNVFRQLWMNALYSLASWCRICFSSTSFKKACLNIWTITAWFHGQKSVKHVSIPLQKCFQTKHRFLYSYLKLLNEWDDSNIGSRHFCYLYDTGVAWQFILPNNKFLMTDRSLSFFWNTRNPDVTQPESEAMWCLRAQS